MSNDVAVIDYGASNLLSITRALEYCGCSVIVADCEKKIRLAEKVVLPGVGSFAMGMSKLNKGGFSLEIENHVKKGKPLLGICLGMQMLMGESSENGITEGLGLIPGIVKKIPTDKFGERKIKVPHIGWNELKYNTPLPDKSLLTAIPENSPVYFVHSFMAKTERPETVVAYCNYGGVEVSAAIQDNNIYGCQFHPEKSGEVGLDILRAFIRL